MRKSTLAIPSCFAAVVGLAVACSGKNARDADIGLDASAPAQDSGNDFPLPAPDGAFADPDAGNTPVGDAGGRPYDAGPPITLDGGLPCVVGGVAEDEPNDSPGNANSLSPTVCGQTDPATESDYLQFQIKPSTKHMYLGYAGNVKLTVTVDNRTVVLSPQTAPALPFVRGKRYSVQVESFDGAAQRWRVTLFEFDQ